MLNEQTLNQLRALRLDGMVAALSDAATHITASELPFEQRLALLVQREVDWRDSKRLERLLKAARLKVSSACLEDIDWRASRGLSREVITSLAGGDWLRHGHNVLLTGATGCGKTWLACAAHPPCLCWTALKFAPFSSALTWAATNSSTHPKARTSSKMFAYAKL